MSDLRRGSGRVTRQHLTQTSRIETGVSDTASEGLAEPRGRAWCGAWDARRREEQPAAPTGSPIPSPSIGLATPETVQRLPGVGPEPATDRSSPLLRIHLFGPLELYRGSERPAGFSTQKATALFAYIVMHRHRLHSRDALIGTLYGKRSEPAARKCFRTELWRVRSVLEPRGTPTGTYLVIHNHEIGFNCATPHWLDIEEFEGRLAEVCELSGVHLTTSGARALRQAIELYRGDALEGIYEDWCVYERERFKRLFRSALECLMHHHDEQGQWDLAIPYGQRLLSCDPLLEHVHRALMRYYYARGDRPAAVRQYHACERLLNRELRVEPMGETVALYEAIRTEHEPNVHSSSDVPPASHAASALPAVERLDRVLAELHALETELVTVRRELVRESVGTSDAPAKS